jgi:hypothetical protein
MTFNKTTRAIALLTGIALVGCLYMASELLFLSEISSYDEETARFRIQRSVDAYERDLEALDRSAYDWSVSIQAGTNHGTAAWPVQAPHVPALIIELDRDGKVISARRFGDALLELQPDNLAAPLIQAGLIGRPVKGILGLEDGPYLVASRPDVGTDRHTILTIDRFEGPSMSETDPNLGKVEVLYRDVVWPAAFHPGTEHPDAVVLPRDQHTLSGYYRLNDVLGRPHCSKSMSPERSTQAVWKHAISCSSCSAALCSPLAAFSS